MIKITENIIQIKLKQGKNHPDVNVYVLLKEKVLIDIGPKSVNTLNLLKKELASLGLSFETLNLIILTHHHVDHVGLLEYLPSGLRIVGPDHLDFYSSDIYKKSIQKLLVDDDLSIEFKNDIEKQLTTEIIPSINRKNYVPFSESKKILQQFGLTAVELSGHSSEDIVITDSENNCFTGDIIIPKIFFNCIYEVDKVRPKHQRWSYYHELNFLDSLVNLVLPGHGDILKLEELKKAVLVNRKRMKRTEKKIIRELNKETVNGVENVCRNVFQSFLPYSKFLPFSEVVSVIESNDERINY
ncbi:hypothetical protein C5O77_01075 (plasmid) [Limosilactobacillus reuteri]|uniref:MBL fold metallo-hydrolase n=1 Tax=Limosilactobacillus reuteri TaxID=1598 RepID=A0A3M6SGM6_LIMRT|nr:MBL fold metallo-hydrolase [Limosilactobacillus reuteri]MRG90118.1 MBL fold metallo-hydrolase [Limosilactobacillus reuteri]RMX26565.1 hypothetical protein C5O77_01075 [Limosilactobacillus reuteri]